MKSTKSFPQALIERDGPFREFKQDGSIVSVELVDGTVFKTLLLIHPNIIGAMPGVKSFPFDPQDVARIYQTEDNLINRSTSDWTFFLNTENAQQRVAHQPVTRPESKPE